MHHTDPLVMMHQCRAGECIASPALVHHDDTWGWSLEDHAVLGEFMQAMGCVQECVSVKCGICAR